MLPQKEQTQFILTIYDLLCMGTSPKTSQMLTISLTLGLVLLLPTYENWARK